MRVARMASTMPTPAPDDAGPGRSGGTHALETEDEQQGAGEIGGLDVDRQRHHAPSFFLNMPSMRSVTT